MSAALKLSDGISILLHQCQAFRHASKGQRLSIDGADALRLHRTLTVMQAMANNMEIELACFRDMEAAHEIQRGADQSASALMSRLITEVDGNVIHMDFGRKP